MKKTHHSAEYGIFGMNVVEDSDDRFYAEFEVGLPWNGKYKGTVLSSIVLALPFVAVGFFLGPVGGALAFLVASVGINRVRRERRPIASLEMTADKLTYVTLQIPHKKVMKLDNLKGEKGAVKRIEDSFDLENIDQFRVHTEVTLGHIEFDYGNTSHRFQKRLMFADAMNLREILNNRRLKFRKMPETAQTASEGRTVARSASF